MNGTKRVNGNQNGSRRNGNGNKSRAMVVRPNEGVEKLKSSVEMMFEASEPALNSALDYLRAMLDPASHEPQQIPDWVTSMSAVFKAPAVVDVPACGPWTDNGTDAKYDGTANGQSTVLLFPGTTASIWHTLGDQLTVANAQDFTLVPSLIAHDAPGVVAVGQISHAFRIVGGALTSGYGIVPRMDVEGIPWYEINCGEALPATGWNWYVSVAPDEDALVPANGISIRIGYVLYDDTAGFVAGVLNDSSFATIPIPAQIKRFNIFVTGAAGSDTDYRVMLTTRNNASIASIDQYSATAYRVLDTPAMENLDQTVKERTTALSGLLTYMGSDLANGGQVAAARLPVDMSIVGAKNGDIYSFLARQPFYAGDYPLRKGAYSFWLPDSLDEYSYTTYKSPRCDRLANTACLAFTMRRDDPTQAVRLLCYQHFEMLTRSVTYTSSNSAVNEFFEVLLSRFKELPAVTENPAHRTWIAKAWRFLKKEILTPKNFGKVLSGVGKFVTAL